MLTIVLALPPHSSHCRSHATVVHRRTTSRAHGQLSSCHLWTRQRIVRFCGESLELASYFFGPGLADVHQNGTAVTAGLPPSWFDLSAASQFAFPLPIASHSLLGLCRLGYWGGEGLLWPAWVAGANVAALVRTPGRRGVAGERIRVSKGADVKL